MPKGVYYVGPASTYEEAISRFRSHTGYMACDTETVSTKDQTVIGIGFAMSAVEGIFFFALDPEDTTHKGPHKEGYLRGDAFQDCLSLLTDSHIKWYFNAYFDLEVLKPLIGEFDSWHDMSIVARVQGLPNSLEGCVGEVLYEPHTEIQDLIPHKPGTLDHRGNYIEGKPIPGFNMLQVDPITTAVKCINDCKATWRLVDQSQAMRWVEEPTEPYEWQDVVGWKSYDVTPEMKAAYWLDRRMIPLLRRMGQKGIKLNKERLLEHYERLASLKFRYQSICEQQFGFNPGSNQQLGFVLGMRGNWLPFTDPRKQKQLKVDEDTLLSLSDPLAHIALNYRKAADQLSDVVEPWLGKPRGEKGKRVPFREWVFPERVYTHWRLDLATARLASFDDNLQNKTPSLRDCLMPDSGTWTWWDASQIEMRLFAEFSQDPLLIKAYLNNESIHLNTMHALFPGQPKFLCCNSDKDICGGNNENPVYTDSKTFNFAMIFNAEAVALARQTRRQLEQCKALRNTWLETYHVGHSWMQWAGDDGLEHGWVTTLEGRRCRIPTVEERGEHHARTCGINYRIQGSASWPIKVAMLKMDEDGFDMSLQVHDEVISDGDYEETAGDLSDFLGHPLLDTIPTPIEWKKGPIWR